MVRPTLQVIAAAGVALLNILGLAAAIGEDFSVNLLTLVPFTFE